MTTENKIKCVLMDFEINKITLQEATKQILLLLNVVGQSEQLVAFLKWVGDGYDFENNAEKIVKEYIDECNVSQLNEVADYTSKLNLKNRIMNTEKTRLENENQPSCLGDVISRFNSDTFIDNVCLSYRHDFGLMAEQDRQRLRFECKEWMRAISNNWEYFKNGL